MSAAPRAEPACRTIGQAFDPVTPEAKQIDALLTRYAQYGFAGSVLVRQAGRPVLARGYGWAIAEERSANGPSTLFDTASLAKTFTAAAILDLEARGRLSTGDPLSKYLPGLPPDKQAITLHHLLTHMSGYPLDAADAGVAAADSAEAMLAKAASATLLHAPGSRYAYSNLGYGLLAHVIERASGQSWQAYVRRRLLRRAGLRNAFLFGERLPARARLARGYMGASEEEAVAEAAMTAPGPNRLLWGKHPLGSVGVYATVGDLDRWWCALNGPRLLPPVQRARLFTVQAADQGYGWNIAEEGGRVRRIHRGGLRGAYQSLVAHYPARGDLIVYAINKNVGGSLWASLVWNRAERILSGQSVELPPALAEASEAAIDRVTGDYRLPSGGKFLFRKSGRTLYFGAEGQDSLDPLEFEGRPIPASRDRLHETSLQLTRALAAGDREIVAARAGTTQVNVEKLTAKWREWSARIGELRGVELLGSTPGAEGHLRTFLRLKGVRGSLVVRLLWDASKASLLAWGDDIPLPAYARVWPQGDGAFVSHDLASGKTRYFRFDGDRVQVLSGSGAELAAGSRRR
ncbi:MAG TPA: serine hydrolase domain-containing protein [Allosphingosinicella sp.]